MIGFVGLLQSKKATMSLIILGVSAAVSLSGHMDASFAAIIGTIATIYMWTVAKTETAQIAATGQSNVATINSAQSGKAPPPTNIPQ